MPSKQPLIFCQLLFAQAEFAQQSISKVEGKSPDRVFAPKLKGRRLEW